MILNAHLQNSLLEILCNTPIRRSYRKFSGKKSLKFRKTHRKTPASGPLFLIKWHASGCVKVPMSAHLVLSLTGYIFEAFYSTPQAHKIWSMDQSKLLNLWAGNGTLTYSQADDTGVFLWILRNFQNTSGRLFLFNLLCILPLAIKSLFFLIRTATEYIKR